VHDDIQIARGTAVFPSSAAALEPYPLAVDNTRRNPNLHGLGGPASARPEAHRARVVDDHPATAAFATRLSHSEDAARSRGLHAAALTGGANTRNRACPGAGAATGVARSVGHHLHPNRYALDRLNEVHGHLALDIASATRPAGGGDPRCLRGRTTVEQAAEDVA
jgi:hypothetical protein